MPEETRNGRTLKEWLNDVDAILMKRIGLGHSDLADFASWDTWDSGAEPSEGAEACLSGDDTYSAALEEGII